jgi:hypothetical protein
MRPYDCIPARAWQFHQTFALALLDLFVSLHYPFDVRSISHLHPLSLRVCFDDEAVWGYTKSTNPQQQEHGCEHATLIQQPFALLALLEATAVPTSPKKTIHTEIISHSPVLKYTTLPILAPF